MREKAEFRRFPRVGTVLLAAIMVFFCFSSNTYASTPDTFTNKYFDPLPSTSMSDVAYGNGIYVAVGSYGAIVRSTDASNWVNVKTKADSSSYAGVTDPDMFGFNSVAYGNGIFVTTGAYGVILTSPDGTTWSQRTSNVSDNITQVKYLAFNGNSDFYAVMKNKILKSSDGLTWSSVTPTGLSASAELTQITVGNGNTRLAVGSTEGRIYSTTNGTTWTWVQPTEPVTGFQTTGTNLLIWMNDRYFFTNASCYIWTSTDLSSFTLLGAPFKQNNTAPSNIQMFDAYYDGTAYYMFGSAPSYGYGVVYKSTDAITWTMQPYTNNFVTQNATYLNGKYFVLGNEGMMVSSDGSHWNHPWGGIFDSVLFDGTRYIGVGQQGNDGTIWTSADLTIWTKAEISGSYVGPFRIAAYGAGKYVAIGDLTGTRTSLVNSDDGGSWTVQTGINDNSQLNGLAYGNGVFVAVGAKGANPVVKISADGVSWSSPSSLPAGSIDGLYSVAYINNIFVALGDAGNSSSNAVWTSTDGLTWTDHTSDYPEPTDYLMNVVYDGTKYVVTGLDTSTYEMFSQSSDDLSSWSGKSVMPGMTQYFTTTQQLAIQDGVIYMLVADGDYLPAISYSEDQGQTWSDAGVDLTNEEPYSLMEANGRVLISGSSQLIKQSNSSTSPATYTLTYTAGANGSITGTSPQTVNSGEDGTSVTAVANTGYHFDSWSDGKTSATRTDTSVTANKSVTANFAADAPQTYTLTYTAGANGSITGTSPQTVNSGEDGTSVTAVPNTGYHFESWSDGKTSAMRTDTNVTANTSVTANFAADAFTVSFNSNGGSAVSSQTVSFNSYALVPTTPTRGGYTFVSWYSDAQLTTSFNFATTTVTSNIILYAKWMMIETPSSQSDSSKQTDASADILVNGKVESAGKATTTKENGKTKTTVAVDQKKVENKLAAEGQNAVITIPVNSGSDVVVGELDGQMIKNMEKKEAIVEIKTNDASYKLPAQQININAVSNRLGQNVELQDIKIHIEIAAPSAATVKFVESTANKGEFSIVAPPLEFTVQGTYGDKTIEVSRFNAYVERTIAIPDGVDPNKITTGIVVEPDGTVRHVPTKVIQIDGKYYAVINSLTNSTYSVVWHPLEFRDVENHWAKEAVNDMGSRMVVEGVGEGLFDPDKPISRAEFAAIVVRGLGLKLESGTSSFKDVKESDWFNGAITTAFSYGLINGFEDGTFRPNDKITREQSMLIIAKAMQITELKAKLTGQSFSDAMGVFSDAGKVSKWAQAAVSDCLDAGIVTGRNGSVLAPKANVTRAEVALMVRLLLQKSSLI